MEPPKMVPAMRFVVPLTKMDARVWCMHEPTEAT